jgi:hypothetical protein
MTVIDDAVNAACDLSSAAAVYVDTMDDVSAAATALADAERRYYAAIGQTDVRDTRPWPRETAAELLIGRVQALRPYVGLVVSETADKAADALESWGPPQELADAVLAEPTRRGFAARMERSERETVAALASANEWHR